MSEYAPFIRIGLRYVAGILLAKGSIDAATADAIVTDPGLVDSLAIGIEAIAGLIIAVVSELWYRAARREGGAQ